MPSLEQKSNERRPVGEICPNYPGTGSSSESSMSTCIECTAEELCQARNGTCTIGPSCSPGTHVCRNAPRRTGNRCLCAHMNLLRNNSEEDCWTSSGYNYINPFVSKLNIDSNFDKAKMYALAILLLPIRVVGCVLSIFSAWVFCCIGLCGIDKQLLKDRPLQGWRKSVQKMACFSMRMVYAFGSFHHIEVKGKRCSPKEAPILVVAPHSSFADSIIVVAAGPPSIVAKHETSNIPFIGTIINFSQPIYVRREDPNSRQSTIAEIKRRSHSEDEWPHVVIFAEGTCTNREAIIKFKPGAFFPGVPVQPVILRYPNKYDTFTWTWDGPSVYSLVWMTMAQFYSRCQIEYLPVYKPSKEEINDPGLYAAHVQEVMARHLNLPMSDYSFDDVFMMSRAKDMKIPFPGDIAEIERLLVNLGFVTTNRDIELSKIFYNVPNNESLSLKQLSVLIKTEITNKDLINIFTILDHKCKGVIRLKSFIICSLFCKYLNDEPLKLVLSVFNMYVDSERCVSRQSFERVLRHSGKMTTKQCYALFYAIDNTNKGYIVVEDFVDYVRGKPKYKFLFQKPEYIRTRVHTGKDAQNQMAVVGANNKKQINLSK